MDDTWLNSFFDDVNNPTPERGSVILRPRGGGAAAHRAGKPVVLATSLQHGNKFTREEIGEEPSGSCVPAAFEWITSVKPPPRLKRSRKSEAHDVSHGASSTEDNLESLSSDSAAADCLTNEIDAQALSDALDGDTLALTHSFTSAFDFGTDCSGGATNISATNLTTAAASRRSSSRRSAPSGSRRSSARPAVAPTSPAAIALNAAGDVSMDADMPPPPPGPPPSDLFVPEMATFGVSALAPVSGVSKPSGGTTAPEDKKARHNLTERKRITRMNELFDRLSAAIEEPIGGNCAEPLMLGDRLGDLSNAEPTADASELADQNNPPPPVKERSGASKAKVLEGALRCIRDLKQKLAEERMARSVLSVKDLEAMTQSCASEEGDGVLGEVLQRTPSDYKDVAW